MKSGLLVFTTIYILLAPYEVMADTADDYNFPPTNELTGSQYQLCNTSDIQAYGFIDVGDAALYLEDCNHQPFMEQGHLLLIRYNLEFTAQDFRDSSEELLKRNLSQAEFESLKTKLAAFNSNYQAVQSGDAYAIGTNAEGLMQLFLNGELVGQTDSQKLSKAYFNIWFGPHPFNEDMKASLIPSPS